MKNLAQKLKFFRISQGFSQSDIAKMLNIPQTTWSGYERGRSNPTIGVLSQLEKLGFDYKSSFTLAVKEAGLSEEEAKNKIDMAKKLHGNTPIEVAGKIVAATSIGRSKRRVYNTYFRSKTIGRIRLRFAR